MKQSNLSMPKNWHTLTGEQLKKTEIAQQILREARSLARATKVPGRMNPKYVTIVGSNRVETWWDSRSKNWITMVEDVATGYEIGNSDYDGCDEHAQTSHLWRVGKEQEQPSVRL